MYEFLCIGIKKLDDGVFQFCQIGLIRKVLEYTGMDRCNGFSTTTKVEAPIGTYYIGYKDHRDWTNTYAYIIRMMSSIESNTRPDISFYVHQWAHFTYNSKASQRDIYDEEMSVSSR